MISGRIRHKKRLTVALYYVFSRADNLEYPDFPPLSLLLWSTAGQGDLKPRGLVVVFGGGDIRRDGAVIASRSC